MSNERRSYSRTPFDSAVTVYYNGLGLLQCRTIDLSYSGISIVTGRITLTRDTGLDVFFNHRHSQKGPQRFGARIVWARDGYAGLAFSDIDSGEYRFLKELVGQIPLTATQ